MLSWVGFNYLQYQQPALYVFQVNYRCKNRFPFPVGGDETITSGEDLQWSGVPLHCDTEEAGEWGWGGEGEKGGVRVRRVRGGRVMGERVRREGFPFPVGGDETITCGDDLQWTEVPLHCDTQQAGEWGWGVRWDFWSDLWWQSWSWKREKLPAFRFPISPLPTDAALKISLHFLHLWSVEQKGFLSDFKKNYRPKCTEVADFCYSGIIPMS